MNSNQSADESRATRISQAFDHGKAFIAFVTAGDPSIERSAAYVEALVDGGADLIELGVPFSDPIAEGPVIQAADVRALQAGTTLDQVFALAAHLRRRVSVPIVLLTYLNPIFRRGYQDFFAQCATAGVDGVIVPDLPFEEQSELLDTAHSHGVHVITLVAPTSADRIRHIAQRATGFVYVVSSMGVTGERAHISTDVAALVDEIRRYTDTPVAVGFGIGTPEQAAAMAAVSDGVIVGSRIVSLIADNPDDTEPILRDYAASIIAAIRQH